jgi:hypothetical protein
MSKNGLSMSEREEKQPADVLQDAICTLEDTPLRILQSTNISELRFRARLSEGCTARLEVTSA